MPTRGQAGEVDASQPNTATRILVILAFDAACAIAMLWVSVRVSLSAWGNAKSPPDAVPRHNGIALLIIAGALGLFGAVLLRLRWQKGGTSQVVLAVVVAFFGIGVFSSSSSAQPSTPAHAPATPTPTRPVVRCYSGSGCTIDGTPAPFAR
ncbi:DUF6234 family protein [Catenulispora subtropica]|uniref:DUF6234 domain-containing protein n=1 Tax=Catenulispora subtropica TaxID=450798 RepID=A0ABP5D9U4_9ACTN